MSFFNRRYRPFQDDPFFSNHRSLLDTFFGGSQQQPQLPQGFGEAPDPGAMIPRGGFHDAFERTLAIPSEDKWKDFVVSENAPHRPEHGQYRSEVHVSSTTYGSDGKPHTTKYSQTTAGDADRKLHQTTQAWSDTQEQKDRIALERHIGDQGRRLYTERDRASGVENRYENLKGMDEQQLSSFDQSWQEKVNELREDRQRLHRLQFADDRQRQQPLEDRRH